MQVYKIAVCAARGNSDIMANYLPVMLSQIANNWLMGLREDSIESWDDLKKVFIENYMATCQQPSTKYDLEKLHQTSREPLRGYIRRFFETRNTIPNIGDSEAIFTFTRGLHHHQELRSKLCRKRPQTIGELLKVANSYADYDEVDRQFKDDVACASRSHCHPHRDDDHREEWHYKDCDRHYDDHECCHNDRMEDRGLHKHVAANQKTSSTM